MAQLIGTMQPCKEDLEKIRKLFLKLYLPRSELLKYVVPEHEGHNA